MTLRDKGQSPYSPDKPSAFPSEAALKRRQRQHLTLDSTDLPCIANLYPEDTQRGWVCGCNKQVEQLSLGAGGNRQTLEDLAVLSFVRDSKLVFTSPDSIRPLSQRVRCRSDLQVLIPPYMIITVWERHSWRISMVGSCTTWAFKDRE